MFFPDRTDCCHTDVTINVADIAGNTGQCRARATVSGQLTSDAGGPSLVLIVGVAVGAAAALAIITAIIVIIKKKKLTACVGPTKSVEDVRGYTVYNKKFKPMPSISER